MKFNLTNLIAIAFLSLAIVLTNLNSAIAAMVQSNPTDTLKEAAQEVVKDTGAKQQFGQSENGDKLLDKAQERASQKLYNLAEEANSSKDLPASKKHFINKVHGN